MRVPWKVTLGVVAILLFVVGLAWLASNPRSCGQYSVSVQVMARIVDAETGQPVEGVQFFASRFRTSDARKAEDIALHIQYETESGVFTGLTWSDADGRVDLHYDSSYCSCCDAGLSSLPDEPPPIPEHHGVRLVELSHPDYVLTQVDPLDGRWETGRLSVSLDLGTIELVPVGAPIEEPFQQEVRVVDANGHPVEAGWLSVHVEGPKINHERWASFSEPVAWMSFTVMANQAGTGRIAPRDIELDTGTASFEVPAGVSRLWIEVHRARAWDGPLGATLVGPVAPSETPLRIVLERGFDIAGSITVPDGAPVEGLGVYATPVRPHYARAIPWWIGVGHADADIQPDGTFTLSGLGAFEYVVEFDLPMEWALPYPILPPRLDGSLALDSVAIKPSAEAEVHVVDEFDEPVANATVRVYYEGPDELARDVRTGHPWFVSVPPLRRADESGVVVYRGLNPGRKYEVRVSPPASRPDLETSRLSYGWWLPKGPAVVTLPPRSR